MPPAVASPAPPASAGYGGRAETGAGRPDCLAAEGLRDASGGRFDKAQRPRYNTATKALMHTEVCRRGSGETAGLRGRWSRLRRAESARRRSDRFGAQEREGGDSAWRSRFGRMNRWTARSGGSSGIFSNRAFWKKPGGMSDMKSPAIGGGARRRSRSGAPGRLRVRPQPDSPRKVRACRSVLSLSA